MGLGSFTGHQQRHFRAAVRDAAEGTKYQSSNKLPVIGESSIQLRHLFNDISSTSL
jgi:hypothetical protein